MNPTGLAGTQGTDPLTFIVTLGGYIPLGFTILYAVCILLSLLMMASAGIRQIATARGRGETTTGQNLMHALWGGVVAVIAELIGAFGQGLFGDSQSAAVLLYTTKSNGGSVAAIAMAAFLLLVQFIGACGCVYSVRIWDRLSSNKPYPGETAASAFWYAFGGLCCVFIQQSIGLFSGMTGMNAAGFINGL